MMRSLQSWEICRFLGNANFPLIIFDAVLEKFLGSRGSVNGYHPTNMMYRCTAEAQTSAALPSYTFGACRTSYSTTESDADVHSL